MLDLVRKHGGDYDVIEGSWRPDRLVVARYPSRQAISDFYNDPDYVPLKKLREEGSTAAALAVEGSTWEGSRASGSTCTAAANTKIRSCPPAASPAPPNRPWTAPAPSTCPTPPADPHELPGGDHLGCADAAGLSGRQAASAETKLFGMAPTLQPSAADHR